MAWPVAFLGCLHAGVIKAYIQFVLALSARAIAARSTSSTRRAFHPSSAKYDFRCFLLALEMVGDEFKTARKHLLAKWRYKPATVDGRAVPSSTVITLRFELET